jgi:hypothetical protein
MERSEAEAVYDAGRERCVDVIVGLAGERERFAARCERLEQRVARLEEQARGDSRNSSSPPSLDPPPPFPSASRSVSLASGSGVIR